MATFEKRGNSWQVRVCFNRERKSATFDTREEAERWAQAQEIDVNARPNVATLRKHSLPKRISAVYFLFANDELIYVGQTSDLHRRLCRHRETLGTEFDRYAHIPCDNASKRLALEAHYIRTASPSLNRRLYVTDAIQPPTGRAARKRYAMELANDVISRACVAE